MKTDLPFIDYRLLILEPRTDHKSSFSYLHLLEEVIIARNKYFSEGVQ